MGRTLPTFNLQLEREMEEWRPFRRALRREDQEVFDRLFALAKRHMAEAAYVARPVPFDTLVMAILLEMQKEIEGKIADCGLEGPLGLPTWIADSPDAEGVEREEGE